MQYPRYVRNYFWGGVGEGFFFLEWNVVRILSDVVMLILGLGRTLIIM